MILQPLCNYVYTKQTLYGRAVFEYVSVKVSLNAFKVIVVYDDGQDHLLFHFCHQVADVWLCDANEAGGPAGWRLFLH